MFAIVCKGATKDSVRFRSWLQDVYHAATRLGYSASDAVALTEDTDAFLKLHNKGLDPSSALERYLNE